MRNIRARGLLSSAALIAVTTGAWAADVGVYQPAPVPPPVLHQLLHVLSLEGWGGARAVTSTDEPDDNTHATAGGAAYASIPLGERVSAQFDAQGEFNFDNQDYAPRGGYMLGGHLSYRDPSHFLIGGFAGFGQAAYNDETDFDGFGYVVGAEGQVYVDRLTLYGQAGVGDFKVDNSGSDVAEGFINGWFARGVARYFFTDDFYAEGEYAYGYTNCYIDNDCAPDEDAGIFHNWGAKAVFRLPHTDMPAYMTLAYQGGSYYATDDEDTGIEHAFRVGLKVLLGKGGNPTLFANDRYGATLDMPMLPVRAASWTEALD